MDKEKLAKYVGEIADSIESGEGLNKPTIAVTNFLSELGDDNVNRAIENMKDTANIVIVGNKYKDSFETYEASSDEENAEVISKLFKEGKIDAAVTMHYPFPIGVSTVGKISSPANGKDVYIANTTGTSDTNRNKAMVLNAIAGLIAAKADGVENPSLGILNVEGARMVEKALKKLNDNGFEINFGESKRADGGCVLRGNDLIAASCDVVVTDSLTGNVLIKTFSSFTSGGFFETTGAGYGPSIGRGYNTPVFIVSRASGNPVIESAIKYASSTLKGGINKISKETYDLAYKCGLEDILASFDKTDKKETSVEKIPEKEIVTVAIGGVDILEIDDAIASLYAKDIYAESAMGCTGPVVMVNEAKEESARKALQESGFIE